MKRIFSFLSLIISCASSITSNLHLLSRPAQGCSQLPSKNTGSRGVESELTVTGVDCHIKLGLEFFVHFRLLFTDPSRQDDEPFTITQVLSILNDTFHGSLQIVQRDLDEFMALLDGFNRELPHACWSNCLGHFRSLVSTISPVQFGIFLRLADYFLLSKPNSYWLICVGIVLLQKSSSAELIQLLLQFAEYVTQDSQILNFGPTHLTICYKNQFSFTNPIVETFFLPLLQLYGKISTLETISIVGINLKMTHIRRINEIFASNVAIRELTLCSNNLMHNFLQLQFKHLTQLKRITVRNNYIRLKGFSYFMLCWENYFRANLCHFDISMNCIFDRPWNFGDWLDYHEQIQLYVGSIESICISRNLLSTKSISTFRIFTSIKSIDFSVDFNNSERATQGEFIGEFLGNFPLLESLTFSCSGISDQEFTLLTKRLAHLPNFHSLSITSVNLTMEHITLICTYLPTLVHLKLAHCSISNAAFTLIFSQMISLKSLYLVGNPISLFKYTLFPAQLETLNLTMNHFSTEQWLKFYDFLPNLKFLREIKHNQHNGEDDEILNAILISASKCPSLESMELPNFQFNNANARLLMYLIQNRMLQLKTLDLSGSMFRKGMLQQLLSLIEQHPDIIKHLVISIPEEEQHEFNAAFPLKSGLMLFH